MKIICLTSVASGLLACLSFTATAQENKSSQKTAVYEPIKPVQLKITPPGVFVNRTVNLFDYPEGSVLYVLNRKETVDKAEFMRRIKQAQSGIIANRVLIGLPDANHKRTIEVDYVVR